MDYLFKYSIKMKTFLFLLFLITFSSAQVSFVPPYISQCPGYNALVYEKSYPCSWDNFIMIWDMRHSKFICDNVPSNYTFNYSIIVNDPANIQPFSAALWDDPLIDSENTAYPYLPMEYTEEQYLAWINGYPSIRFNANYYIQPINTPYCYDFTGNTQNVASTIFTSPRMSNNGVIFYINRENLTPQFNCFNLTVSVNIF